MRDALRWLGWRLNEAFFPEGRPVSWWALGGRAVTLAVVTAYGAWFFRVPLREIG